MKPVNRKILIQLIIVLIAATVTAQESEHPPLPENTKKAIAVYKRNPNEANKENLLKIMNENYDAIIQTKKDKLEERIRDRNKNVNRWLKAVTSGDMPPFMKLNTENHKGDERQVIAKAIEAYRKNPSAKNEDKIKEALEAYYDVFLEEQVKHIKETEDSREMRMAASLERFTSDRFRPGIKGAASNVKQEESLAEIICNYISIGAEIVPVNPEARVRERGYNAAINAAQAEYLKNPTLENRNKLRAEIAAAFHNTYDVRIEEFNKAQSKGLNGGRALLSKISEDDFLESQFADLTEQRNLYGRIDRMITFGSNTVVMWQPRLKIESEELAKLIMENKTAPSSKNKQLTEAKFNEIYTKMLALHSDHLKDVKDKLEIMIDKTLIELAD